MATIRNIADAADVSIATVSRSFNKKAAVSPILRQRVFEAANRLGYGGAPRAATNIIALAFTGRRSLGSPYDNALLDGMATAADEIGADLAILRLQSDRQPGESYSHLLQRKGIRAAVIRTNSETRAACIELARDGFPCVVVGDRFPDHPVNYLYCDSRPSTHAAISHLISLGHQRIAIAISHIPDSDHADRLEAYESALQENNIAVDPKLIFRVWAMRSKGEQLLRTIMSLPTPPTAIYIADPLVAVGLTTQALSLGVGIPQDLSVIGFDDADTRFNVYPQLSAVCQDARGLGNEAVSTLMQILHDEPRTPIQKSIPTSLELNGTTGPAAIEQMRILPGGTRIAASPAVPPQVNV